MGFQILLDIVNGARKLFHSSQNSSTPVPTIINDSCLYHHFFHSFAVVLASFSAGKINCITLSSSCLYRRSVFFIDFLCRIFCSSFVCLFEECSYMNGLFFHRNYHYKENSKKSTCWYVVFARQSTRSTSYYHIHV